ncbi:MAG: phosphonate C-P lyase system protein PhnG [Silicimonas sp.]|nr:phosphonate C-P lyase system protein PhnG [Silicimonas sp.]
MSDEAGRKDWMGLLARAKPGRIAALLEGAELAEPVTYLRAPEIGSVMVRGRAGGTGAPFNLGEMSVTRCTLKLAGGAVGHGHVQGRSRGDAEAAALVDALMQGAKAEAVRAAILAPLHAEETARRQARAARAAATKVEFFTMTRGED